MSDAEKILQISNRIVARDGHTLRDARDAEALDEIAQRLAGLEAEKAQLLEIDEGWTGCGTGDCPHDTVHECAEALVAVNVALLRGQEILREAVRSEGNASDMLLFKVERMAELETKIATLQADTARLTEVREEVREFAVDMEAQLAANDHKGGWQNDSLEALQRRVFDESRELKSAIFGNEASEVIVREAADVANFAMMIANVARLRAARESEVRAAIDAIPEPETSPAIDAVKEGK